MYTKLDKSRTQELVVYIILWVGTLAAPVVDHYLDTLQTHIDYDWGVVLNAVFGMLPFLVTFWLHDLFVAPCLMRSDRHKAYFFRLILLMSLFVLAQCILRPQNKHFDIDEARRVEDIGSYPIHEEEPLIHFSRPAPPTEEEQRQRPFDKHEPDQGPQNPVGLIHFAMAIMLCGLNLGVKFFFKSRRNELALMRAKHSALEKELEFLTYQISPHFFMNTLNNIHALIDINPEQAKNAVIELSKMLRYALYEGRATTVRLDQEIDCMSHFISLMRLRYTDKVDIRTNFPSQTDACLVPPMLCVTFLENAFKHGVSYRHQSFIHVSVHVSGEHIHFECVNSVAPRQTESKGGVGLANVQKRLQLIYQDKYTLTINQDSDIFCVQLTIPSSL